MKKLFVAAILGLTLVSGWAQGTVDFRNAGITFITTADRSVYQLDGSTKLAGSIGSNYVAQLFFAVGGGIADPAAMAASGAPVGFTRPSTSASAGAWLVPTGSLPTRTLNGVAEGGTATLQVRVWDITQFTSYDLAKGRGGITGESSLFNYTVPAAGSPANQYYMDNLRSFAIHTNVPEPSTIALGAIGLASLLFLRRRK